MPAQTAAADGAGQPFSCTVPTFFAQTGPDGNSTQLNTGRYVGASSSWTPLGAAASTAATTYNGLAFNPIDSYLYAALPSGTIVRIDSAGVQSNAAGAPNIGTATLWDSGTFDNVGNYYVATGNAGTTSIKVLSGLGAGGTVTQSTLAIPTTRFADLSFKDGFLWGANYGAANPAVIHRINPANGTVTDFAMPTGMPAANYGASFTGSNGNLVFISPNTMYQVVVANPTTTPTATLLSSVPAPTNSRADGAICNAQPANLSIVKTGPTAVALGGSISWNLKISNVGPGASTGFIVKDQVPASVTNVAVTLVVSSTENACSVVGNAVTCNGGLLMPNDSIDITVSGTAPSTAGSVVNTATVVGNEQNTSGITTSTPPATTVGDISTVTAVNDPAGTVALGNSVVTNVRSNDSTTAGFTLSAPTIFAQPASGQGTAAVQANGSIQYTAPASGFSGATSYQYQVCNNASPSACATATVSVTVANSFTPGSAVTAGVNTPQNTAIDVPLATVAAVTGSSLDPTKTTVATNVNGTTAVDAAGKITFTPNSGFHGPTTLTVSVTDTSAGTPQTKTYDVVVTVGGNMVTAAPVSASTSVETLVDVPVSATSSSSQPINPTPRVGADAGDPLDAPNNGSIAVQPDNTIRYVPDAGFSGVDTFEYELCDTSTPSFCDTAVVTVTVANVFGPGDDVAGISTPQNKAIVSPFAALATSTGAELDPDSVTSAVGPAHGSISISATGDVTYTPKAGFTGTDSYDVKVCDLSAPSQCTTVTITVTVGANVVTAVPDPASTTVAAPVQVTVLGNDTVTVGGAALNPSTVSITSAPANGTASVNTTTGVVTYTPEAKFSGVDTFNYSVCDTSNPTAVCSTATVTVTVDNGFTAAVGGVATPQNTAVATPLAAIVTTTGALADPTTVTQAAAPLHGSIAIDQSTGAVTYTPTTGYSGSDSYTVNVCDLSVPVQCSIVIVPVTVGANLVDAKADTAATSAVTSVIIPVLANDTTTAGGAPLDKASVTVPISAGHGTTTVTTSTGAVTYKPAAGFSGTDSFMYRVCDTTNPTPVCDTATVTITVVNVFTDGPAAAGISTLQNTDITTPIAGLVTVTGSPLDPASVAEVTAPIHGSITTDQTTGAVTYTPDSGYSGPDSYSVSLCDTAVAPECTTVTVSVTVGANAVLAAPDAAATNAETAVTSNVLVNDAVLGGGAALNPTSVSVSVAPAHGTTSVNSITGEITYTPAAGFSGTDVYTYRVCDTSAPTPVCGSAVVTVTVTNVFVPGPGTGTGAAGAIATGQNAPITVPVSDIVSTSGLPIDPATVAVKPGTTPANGSVAIDPITGRITFIPTPGFSGPETFGVTFCDTGVPANCGEETVTIVVAANVVTAKPDAVKVGAGDRVVISPLGNDTSASGQPLNPTSVTVASQPSHGSVTVNSLTGDLTYTPASGWMGTDDFSYTVCDTSFPTPVCSTTTVSVTTLAAALAHTGGSILIGLQLALATLLGGVVLILIKRRRDGRSAQALNG